MRGSTAEVREKQREYVEDFRECAPVLDVGCGRGEFLQLLREAGIEARGIDADPDMVAFCVGEGLDVSQHDAISYLEGLPDGALGGIFCAHVLEHLPTSALIGLLELAHVKLRPAGSSSRKRRTRARSSHCRRSPPTCPTSARCTPTPSRTSPATRGSRRSRRVI